MYLYSTNNFPVCVVCGKRKCTPREITFVSDILGGALNHFGSPHFHGSWIVSP